MLDLSIGIKKLTNNLTYTLKLIDYSTNFRFPAEGPFSDRLTRKSIFVLR